VVVMLAGALVGAGLMLGWLAFQRPTTAPVPHEFADDGEYADSEWLARVGRPLGRKLIVLGLPRESVRRDLVVLDRVFPEVHLAMQAAASLVGLLLAWLLQSVLSFSLPFTGALSIIAAGLFWYMVDAEVKAKAAEARADALADLSVFLDITVNALAAGAGVEQALGGAAEIGGSPAFERLRHALDVAFLSRLPIHQVFAELGTIVGLAEITDLAASLQLAGSEGAKIRASLAAKAEAIRSKILADEEAEAAATTERMTVPIALLMTGFLVLIGYPAMASALSAL
jgi:tight adherence protein C